ncbi:MAG: hypothetical protein A2268_08825 [Candidatus Raymondbacteria bacterium RifOxyA12_full_50_37]|uniref:Lipocalin-like domain-containing protein n=1 Tax=Candidatus Raymondbacteria bacterium RIFOXYD12_FULL_49_13 TaxID=1817890 RepID=A0A1F7FGW1_UNCRA|nr:MAG: hypothetical protein A2350_19745 [Candidatus Raymondbacteria bacterium RifOxyB12_full_50_8]OGJ91596.1 MAG: hypothetical protein A2268_08825 [Candidatus Raymondbacteria bacterium RifOxyA12_full_50_37]OGJ92902.1 MAG: hypothetical protein A2248_08525 [Candidatus Raymondbacteria bacterium RIFOXYA2_FULL_49_16]OGJ94829.1 MAG: hypothetical protein A2487_03225 [Candidatus Raymondbacteria bacterium RifOxyC12_full_50_8]OGK05712.1 MAG: hypothetical protein A2519_03945 [Candidatus Raymondbacteria b
MKTILCALLAIACVPWIHATSMFIAGLDELSTESEMIVQAKVTSTVTQWTKDNTQIVTYIRANIVDDLISDKEDNEIILAQPGGKVGVVTMEIEGTTTYKVGDDNILFLRKDPSMPGTWQTIGLYQGKYKIYKDASGVQRVAQEIDGKVVLYKRTADTTPVETGNNLPLDQFKVKVLEYRASR